MGALADIGGPVKILIACAVVVILFAVNLLARHKVRRALERWAAENGFELRDIEWGFAPKEYRLKTSSWAMQNMRITVRDTAGQLSSGWARSAGLHRLRIETRWDAEASPGRAFPVIVEPNSAPQDAHDPTSR